MAGPEGGDEGSAIHPRRGSSPTGPRVLRASTNGMRVFGGIFNGTSLRHLVQRRCNRRIWTGDLELRQRMYRDTLYDIWLSFAFFLLRRASRPRRLMTSWHYIEPSPFSFLFFSYLLGILTRSCSITRWRSVRRSHVAAVAIRNHGVFPCSFSYRRCLIP